MARKLPGYLTLENINPDSFATPGVKIPHFGQGPSAARPKATVCGSIIITSPLAFIDHKTRVSGPRGRVNQGFSTIPGVKTYG